ncbi:MAG: lamin tail domain-containing protein, partial [Candidatus Sumerlaeia bacterium]|nr:lamin tail domain-containing protein [Candidatus Sumerlaeia bacterium]
MKPTLKNCLALGAIALATQLSGSIALGQASTDLLLSEARIVAPGDDTINTTEFIEIFNPTNTAISLDNYFITDRQDYFNLAKHFYDCEQDPLCTDPGLFATSGPTDYVFRFPTGHSIPSGGVVVVTTDIDNFVTVHFGAEATIDDYYDQPGNPQLFTTRTDVVYTQPDDVTPVPAMIRYGASERLSLTNGGEWTALVYVDGTSELVQDVDIVAWRSPSAGNTFPIKGLLTVGDSTYVEEFGDGDTGGNGNLLVRGDSYHVIARTTTIEVGQAGTTGNGRTGQDETMEDSMTTWVGFVD